MSMRFVFRGENFELSEAIKSYAEDKISKVERYFNEELEASAHVNFKIYRKNEQKVEVTISLPQLVIRAEDTNNDIYAAIDVVVDRLERQVRKHKTKVNRKSRELGNKDQILFETVEDSETEEFKVKKYKKFDLHPMDVEEAILQMNLLGHNFFLFLNDKTGKTSVVYKRDEESYGVIEPN